MTMRLKDKSVKIKVLELKNEPDMHGDIMSPDAIIEFPSAVPLVQEFSLKNRFGYASLIREENYFFIENIRLDAIIKRPSGKLLDTNEFLNILKDATPAIGGRILKRSGNTIEKFSIRTISLNMRPNCDPSIKTIGEQLDE